MQLQNLLIFVEKAVWSNLTMFVMEILQVIVIHFSFDVIRTFASFSGHTVSVQVQTVRSLKKTSKKYRRYGIYKQGKFTIVLLQGR